MAKRRRKTKRYRKRKRGYRRTGTHKPRSMIYRGLQGFEKKVRDVSGIVANLLDTASISHINGVAQNVKNSGRIGQEICWVNFHLKIRMYPSTTSVTTIITYVVELIWDRQPNGALATITDIYVDKDAMSHKNLANRDRFRTIYSTGPFVLGPEAGGNQIDSVSWAVFIKCRAKTVFFEAGNDIGNIKTGALLLVARTTGLGGGLGHAFQFNGRLRFNEGHCQTEPIFGVTNVRGGQSIFDAPRK